MIPSRPGQRTLLCILDWGLGHASRSLALANALEEAGEAVFFASCGRAKKFIESERPGTKVYELPGYNVTYPTRSMPLNVALQFPRWMVTIWRERRCCATLVQELRIDRIVSDNRFGCYVPRTRSVFLTHQLHPITNSRLVSRIYRAYLQRFDEFWVPDFAEAKHRVSGQLSGRRNYGHVQYIGPLSRLSAGMAEQQERGVSVLTVMALLSGPEPMRTQLEAIVVAQLSTVPGNHVLVRGLPGSANHLPDLPNNITVYDFADAALLSRLLPAAEHIICRSGYSTLMDVYAVTTGKKLILVPTPGQTEQVYLAKREARRIGCIAVPEQEDLDLDKILSLR
ncbi:hypothetical protein FUA23_15180 [Neolewinella aurantiaca]|uniref:Glycosyl transferase family 28 C-terminal domain-containing protein n=1 Tax=Neolewinella aurantiaca TaxID=2602767 RepID=A0A5C7FS73_9BACT|nr:glycosyltransferase [Neolewinella aurantiaca]TXF88321.1 hypothetical protein FUA23_15180 [Neolewinella aurantiaca]